jgi:hypothetical protein
MADGKQNLLLSSLRQFYNDPENCRVFLDVIQQQARYPSLRILDWLVTNYAKKNSVAYEHNGKEININLSYKQQLRAYSKRQFDPFCRRGRIVFPMMDPRQCPTPPTCCITPHSSLKRSIEISFPEEARLPPDLRMDNVVIHNLVTTTGQLSFFRWAITYGVLAYSVQNKGLIEADMTESSNTKVKHKRMSSSAAAEKNKAQASKSSAVLKKAICKRNVRVVMSFQ